MAGQWDIVRSAIATKLSASAGCTTAGLRKADTNVDDPLVPPCIRVLQVSGFELTDRPNANQESYTLTIPAELVVSLPAGRKRSHPIAADIARAAQVEFQSGIKLGLPTYVVECRLMSWSEGLQDLADTDLDGGRITFQVDVTETIATARTA